MPICSKHNQLYFNTCPGCFVKKSEQRSLEVVIAHSYTDRRSLVVTEDTPVHEVIAFVADWKPGNYPVIQRATQSIFRNLAAVKPGESAGMGIA